MSMALLKNPILLPAAAIGLMSAMLTMIGIRFGQRIGPRWGHWAERAGGCVLLLIALQPLYSFLTAHPSVPR
jgi:putative Mn2+ efflux pump MntP